MSRYVLCHMHAWYLWRPEEGIESLGTRVTVRSHHVGDGDPTQPSPPALLTTEPPLQPPPYFSRQVLTKPG